MPGKRTPWPEFASELYRPSDRRLSEKLMPTFAHRGCHVVSVMDPYGRILDFLDRSRYVFFRSAPQLYSRGWVDLVPDPLLLRKSGYRSRTPGSVTTGPQRRSGLPGPLPGRVCLSLRCRITFWCVVTFTWPNRLTSLAALLSTERDETLIDRFRTQASRVPTAWRHNRPCQADNSRGAVWGSKAGTLRSNSTRGMCLLWRPCDWLIPHLKDL
jgi:hypothetical protein